jgi:hypothetical protein
MCGLKTFQATNFLKRQSGDSRHKPPLKFLYLYIYHHLYMKCRTELSYNRLFIFQNSGDKLVFPQAWSREKNLLAVFLTYLILLLLHEIITQLKIV